MRTRYSLPLFLGALALAVGFVVFGTHNVGISAYAAPSLPTVLAFVVTMALSGVTFDSVLAPFASKPGGRFWARTLSPALTIGVISAALLAAHVSGYDEALGIVGLTNSLLFAACFINGAVMGRCLAIIGWISVDIVWQNARNQRLLAQARAAD